MKSTDPLINAVRQHLEGEAFFAGFTPIADKKNTPIPTSPAASPPISEPQSQPSAPVATPAPPAPEPTAQALQTVPMNLDRLVQVIYGCQKCPLSQQRTHAVPGEGNARARLMFVGEAPGADEDAQGRPFVGKAGQLLDKIIQACGLSRADVYIANTLKCRPPGNRDPLPDEINCCLPYLKQQIMLIEPEIIVALGAHAARTVLKVDDGIGRLRGHFQTCGIMPEKPELRVMPTYHPAYLLRNYTPDTRRRVWEDMKKVIQALGLPLPG